MKNNSWKRKHLRHDLFARSDLLDPAKKLIKPRACSNANSITFFPHLKNIKFENLLVMPTCENRTY